MTKKLSEFKDGFRNAVQSLKGGEEGIYFWLLADGQTEKNDFAIVLGWTYDGDNGCDNDTPFHKDGYQLCAKIAYQSHKNIMQCDFDCDWTMPYEPTEGEVYDVDYFIESEDDIESAMDYLLKCWDKHKDEYMKMSDLAA